jgi:hypothetical protein
VRVCTHTRTLISFECVRVIFFVCGRMSVRLSIYLHICTFSLSLSLRGRISVRINMYLCICTLICMYVYAHTHVHMVQAVDVHGCLGLDSRVFLLLGLERLGRRPQCHQLRSLHCEFLLRFSLFSSAGVWYGYILVCVCVRVCVFVCVCMYVLCVCLHIHVYMYYVLYIYIYIYIYI